MGQKKYEELKANFLKVFANLPQPERSQIIVIIENKPYSWDRVYDEINSDTNLAKKILEKLVAMEVL